MHIVLAVAFFSETPWDIPGGGMCEYVIKIARILQKQGNKVEIIAGALDNKEWSYKGIVVHNAFWYGDIYGSPLKATEAIIRRNLAIQKKLIMILLVGIKIFHLRCEKQMIHSLPFGPLLFIQ